MLLRRNPPAPNSRRQPRQQAVASGTPGTSKAAPKSPVLLTNDNIDDPTAKQTIHGTAQPNAQQYPKATAVQVPSAPKAQSNQQAATSASAAKPKLLLDPHRVLTNDDLRSLGRFWNQNTMKLERAFEGDAFGPNFREGEPFARLAQSDGAI